MEKEQKQYTEKQIAFLDALIGPAQGNIRQAMELAGYSAQTKQSEVVNPLRDEIIERASMVLAINAPRAAFGILGVLDDPSAMGARNSVAAAREILDRTGIVKKEQVEVKGPTGGIFIMPPKQVTNDEQDLGE